MLLVEVHTLVNSFRKFLDIVNLLGIHLIDLSDNLERPMGLTEDLEHLLAVVVDARFLFYLHAVISPLRALYVEVYLAIMMGALYNRSYLWAFFTTNHASYIEL